MERRITSSGTGDPSGLSAFYGASSHPIHSIGISPLPGSRKKGKKGRKWRAKERAGLCISLVYKPGTREPKLTVRLPTAVSRPATCRGALRWIFPPSLFIIALIFSLSVRSMALFHLSLFLCLPPSPPPLPLSLSLLINSHLQLNNRPIFFKIPWDALASYSFFFFFFFKWRETTKSERNFLCWFNLLINILLIEAA